MDKNQIQALIKLLDDPDNGIFVKVKEKMLAEAEFVLPELKAALKSSDNKLFNLRAKNILKKIYFIDIQKKFEIWAKSPDKDLFQGMLLLALYNKPTLNIETVFQKTGEILTDIRAEVNIYLTALQQVRIINHVLFGNHVYKSNFNQLANPDFFFLDKVVDSKTGNDITLAVIYMFLAKKAGLNLHSIDFPRNFLLAFIDERDTNPHNKNKVIFYINPYNRGAIITARDAEAFLERNNIEKKQEYYKPAKSIDVLNRSIDTLIILYKAKHKLRKIKELKAIKKIINKAGKKKK